MNALNIATNVYNWYYTHAIKQFNDTISKKLAQIPADYIYNSLIIQKECYINDKCCLEYCNEVLDSEFNIMDPEIKRKAYEKAFNVHTSISNNEINFQLKKYRNKKMKELYYNSFNEFKENDKNRENQLSDLFNDINLNKNTLESIFKTLNLN